MKIRHKVIIDLAKNNYVSIEVVKGNENTVVLEFYVVENGKKFDLEKVKVVSLKATKPSGNVVFNDVDGIVSSERIDYTISKTIMEEIGQTVCQLQLLDEAGNVLNSYEFYVLVRSNLYDEESLVSQSDLNGFRAYMIRAETAASNSEGVEKRLELIYDGLEQTLNAAEAQQEENAAYMDELKKRVESGEFNGERGQQGEPGANAVVIEGAGVIAFQITEGNLICHYSGDEAPNIYMNDSGELVFEY